MKILELFSGTGSVSKLFQSLDYEVTSLDITDKYFKPTFLTDIMEFNYKQFPVHYFDIIWASPPCTTFSILQNCWIGRGKTKQSIIEDRERVGLPLVRKAEEIIDYLQPTLWFIENPQTGTMKQYIKRPFYDVDYCQYSDWGYRKRTRIWTNLKGFKNKLCHFDCQNLDPKNPHKHRTRVDRVNSLGDRYRVPPLLIQDLFQLQ
jgi:site-specific DNA-cytosine methylase